MPKNSNIDCTNCPEDSSLFDHFPDDFNIHLLDNRVITEERLPDHLRKERTSNQGLCIPLGSSLLGTDSL